jgi:dynein heavy chain, axonemal
MHFANYEDGEKKTLPIFGGQKGAEIFRSLNEIESTFNRYLLELRKVKSTILDVKATSWHQEYNKLENLLIFRNT